MSKKVTATDAEIVQFVRMLMPSFSKKHITEARLCLMKHYYDTGRTASCVEVIMEECGLKGINVKICYIRNRPSRSAVLKLVCENLHYLESPALTNCSPDDFKAVNLENAIAFVFYTPDLPLFGTSSFWKTRIMIFIFMERISNSFENFVECIAHELSHVILDALRHPLRNNEVAVDLTAMILGFWNIMREGRLLPSAIEGYLSNGQFEIAYEEIRKLSGVIYL